MGDQAETGYTFLVARDTDENDRQFPTCTHPSFVLLFNGMKVCEATAGFPDRTMLVITQIETRYDLRRRGHASHLVIELESLARRQHASYVYAKYVAGDIAEALWRSLNYVLVDVEDGNWLKTLDNRGNEDPS
jgi:ribosomal protein S18 acetylase RimI-like enzyme